MTIPARAWLGHIPLIAQRGGRGAGQVPAAIDRAPEGGKHFQDVLHFFQAAIQTYASRVLGKIVREGDVQYTLVVGRMAPGCERTGSGVLKRCERNAYR